MSSMSSSAAPASGQSQKYGGFGSEDISRLGYNTQNKFNAPYDPYTKGQSVPTNPVSSSVATSSATTKTKETK